MSDEPQTVEGYLEELDDDRRVAIGEVRKAICANLPTGYVEVARGSLLAYEVPLETYPDTYNKKPLMYAALASQKRHMSVYLTSIYGDPDELAWFTEAYRQTGKRMDIGKSCVRFQTLDHLPLEVIGEAIARTPVADFIASHKASRS